MRISDWSSDVCSSDLYRYTAKGNLVAVISNGTAVLGLGDCGALAGKPVMEGKAVLFKKFADVDVFDIEEIGRAPSELQSLMRISYAVFCLKKKNEITNDDYHAPNQSKSTSHTLE